MARMTFEEIAASIADAQAAGSIYKVDYDVLKNNASRLLEKDDDVIRAEFMNAGKFQERTEAEYNLIDSLSMLSPATFPSKKTMKLLAACNPGPARNAVQAMIDRWQPVCDGFRSLKGMIVKGRKPSTEPRKTPMRTLENTGTCSICGKNHKLKSGKIVEHGYTLRYGFRNGRCPGVGYDPIETSPEGVIAFVKSMRVLQDKFREKLKQVEAGTVAVPGPEKRVKQGYQFRTVREPVEPDAPNYDTYRMRHHTSLESEIRNIGGEIDMYQKIADNWKPGKLPG